MENPIKRNPSSTPAADANDPIANLKAAEAERLAKIKDEALGSPGVRPVIAQVDDTAKYETPADQRRSQVKTMQQLDERSAAAKVMAETVISEDDKSPTHVLFISPYPNLVIYADLGGTMKDRDEVVRRQVKVQFKNGFFRTDDPELIKAIRSNRRCNTRMFREAPSNEAGVLFRAAEEARNSMRAGAVSGVTTSAQGNDMQFLNNDAQLSNTQDRIFTL